MEKIYRFIIENVTKNNFNKQKSIELLKLLKQLETYKENDIAIIGIATRFGSSDEYNDLWNNIINKRDCITDFPEYRKKDVIDYLKYKNKFSDNLTYFKGAFLSQIDKFDNKFFNIPPNDAKVMDPKQKLFLETAWQAIEDAGYGGERIEGTRTGIYVGFSGANNALNDLIGEIDPSSFQSAFIGNLAPLIASRLSYLLNLNGPSMIIDTTCSSSLVAVHLACQALRNNECEMALAGGVRINLLPIVEMGRIGIESLDGKTRAFDDLANGTGIGEGIGAVMLKPLKRAIQDGDNIYSVIKGSAINQDGASMGIIAPSVTAQTDVLQRAWKDAKIKPETISYIETHGTGTKIGDPIEIEAIKKAFISYTNKKQFCAIGALKNNIGHLFDASGVIGLIKGALALNNKIIPPTINFNSPNKMIDFVNSPLYINDRVREWSDEDNNALRCGISSFGMSGTNCHMVLEQYINSSEKVNVNKMKYRVFTISAKSKKSLINLLEKYKNYIKNENEIDITNLCYTSNLGRGHYNHRIAIIIESKDDLLSKINEIIVSKLQQLQSKVIYYNKFVKIDDSKLTKQVGEVTECEIVEFNEEAERILQELLKLEFIDLDKIGKICSLYVKGAKVNWEILYKNDEVKTISMPTYCFDSKRLWIDLPNLNETSILEDVHSIVWREKPLNEKYSAPLTGNVIILMDEKGISNLIVNELRGKGIRVITIKLEQEYKKISEDEYEIFNIETDYYKVIEDKDIELDKISHIIHLQTLTNRHEIQSIYELEKSQNEGVYSLFFLLKSVMNKKFNKLNLILISEYANEITGREKEIKPENAILLGVGKCISKEDSRISCKAIDVDKFVNIHELINEISSTETNYHISYREGKRYIEEFGRIETPNLEEGSYIKEDGVYIITGGAGGIGIELTKRLSKEKRINIIWIGRKALPPREKWNDVMECEKDGKVLDIIKELIGFEENGVNVEYYSSNVSKIEDMKVVIDIVLKKYGRINGIIHCAGIAGNGFLINKDFDKFKKVLLPKVEGTWILNYLTKNIEMDFFMLFSSTSSLIGEAGQGDYTAANCYLNAFSYYRNKKGYKTVSINWPAWKEVGMAVDYGVNVDSIFKTISNKDAMDKFKLCIRYNFKSPIIGKVNYNNKILKKLVKSNSLSFQLSNEIVSNFKHESNVKNLKAEKPKKLVKLLGRKDNNYTKFEMKLGEIWSDVLGYDEIDIFAHFYDLGGDSIIATKLVNNINKTININASIADLLKLQTIKKFSEYVEHIFQENEESKIEALIPSLEKKEYYQLSSAQKRLFILKQIEQDDLSYNMPGVISIRGRLDKERMQKVVNMLVDRQESFRTSFKIVNGMPVQIVHEKVECPIKYMKLDGEKFESLISKFIDGFNLEEAPLLRVGIINISNEENIIIFDMHHIISDGISMQILARELSELYEGRELPSLSVSYKDFAEWQNNVLESEEAKLQENYWLRQFEGQIPLLELPLDFNRKTYSQSNEGEIVKFKIDRDTLNKVKALSIGVDATLYMTILATYNVLLSKYSNQEDIVVGSPILGRMNKDVENIVGMFVNTLPMRNYLSKEKSFLEFLSDVKENTLQAYKNQDYQFEKIVEKLNIHRNTNRNPLFDTLFNFIQRDMNMPQITVNGLEFIPYKYENKTAKFDLSFTVFEDDEELYCEFLYRKDLFKNSTIELLGNSFINIIKQIVNQPFITIKEIQLLSLKEKNLIINDYNNTNKLYPSNKTIHELFTESVAKNLDKIAIKSGTMQITYKELDSRSNQLARMLIREGTKKDDLIAFIAKPSIEMIIGIIGILKSGAAYVPISPQYPKERITYILDDCNAKILLTDLDFVYEGINELKVLNLNDETSYIEDDSKVVNINTPDDLAYVIYTSGSTGNPKGVMVEHKSVSNILFALQDNYAFLENDTYLLKTAFTFDVSVTEIFGWFLGNGTLVILESGYEKDPHSIYETIVNNHITHINFIPSMLEAFLNSINIEKLKHINSLKYIFVAGEAMYPSLVHKFFGLLDNIMLVNLYGPTEATIYATGYEIKREDANKKIIPIGNPLSNYKIFILDTTGNIVPIGRRGVIYISGKGIARGYLNRENLTKEKFVVSHLVKDEVMYNTGDLGAWNEDGTIDYIGRADNQVKIRGFRIELGEIEEKLKEYESINEVVVTVKEGENKYLCAYFTSSHELSHLELRGFLLNKIPEYMIPQYFIQVDSIPKLINGKLDKASLPSPMLYNSNIREEFVKPVNNVEKEILAIWEEILKVDKISMKDNFFELGGTSLLLIQMHNKIEQSYPGKIKVTDIFGYPTIEDISKILLKSDKNIDIKYIKLKEDYFNRTDKNETDNILSFKISEEIANKYNLICKKSNFKIFDVFLGMYIYVLSEISNQQQISIYTMKSNIDIKEISANLSDIEDLGILFEHVSKFRKENTNNIIYKFEELKNNQKERDSNGIITMIYEKEHKPINRNLVEVFDMIFELNVINNQIEFVCEFNSKILRKDKVKDLISKYIKLINVISNLDI